MKGLLRAASFRFAAVVLSCDCSLFGFSFDPVFFLLQALAEATTLEESKALADAWRPSSRLLGTDTFTCKGHVANPLEAGRSADALRRILTL